MREPGGPGDPPPPPPRRRQALGALPGPGHRLWFTIADGHLSEVFYPTIDQPILHSLRFIATAPDEEPFDDVTEARHEVRWLEPGIPSFRVETRHPEYSLTTEIVLDSNADVLVVNGLFRPELPDVRLHLLAIPHNLADGRVLEREPPALAARLGGTWLVLVGPFARCAAGHLGVTDLLTDLREHEGTMSLANPRAAGHIGLGAELAVAGGPFQVGIGLGESLAATEEAVHASLSRGISALRDGFARAWRVQNAPDRDLLRVAGDGGDLARCSVSVLRCLEDGQHEGAFVTGPAEPTTSNRDIYHAVTALLDAGDPEPARRALARMEATQRPDGSWPARYSLSGKQAHTEDVDLGQVALPILLAWRLGAAERLPADPYPRLIRRAAAWLVSHGPTTNLDRWLDTPGESISPSSLAAAVAGLLAAAEFADDAHEPDTADHLRVVADYWQDSVERWAFLASEQRYVRLADPVAGPRTEDVSSLEFLELVRRGVRRAQDPRVLNSLGRADAELRDGMGWRRQAGDLTTRPVLIGERGHHALAAGEQAASHIRRLEATAGPELVLPEEGQGQHGIAPLGWAHAEYLRLLAALARASLPDLITPARLRCLEDPIRRPPYVWHHRHRFERMPKGRRLRTQLGHRGSVAWTGDGWATSGVVEAREAGPDCWIADLPVDDLPGGADVEWTVSYADGRWEEACHKVRIEPLALS